jgi:branched-subunit amino acid ABC-type transport system permease component
VVIIIGGIGSIRGAFVASILVGLIDTVGRGFLPDDRARPHGVERHLARTRRGPRCAASLFRRLMR